MSWRAGVFFVALTVLIGATFDAFALLLSGQAVELVYLPAAIVAAILMAHARIPSRLPDNVAWYAVLLVLAVAFVVGVRTSVVVPALARPLLLAAIVMVLMRLTPHAGSVYERTSVPGVLVFFAFTALLYQSVGFVVSLRALGISHPALGRFPAPMVNVVVSAVLVAIFVVASGIRHRFLQPNPSRAWLWAGLSIWLAAAAASHVRAYFTYAFYTLAFAQVLLFVGAFYLLANLLPRRREDEGA